MNTAGITILRLRVENKALRERVALLERKEVRLSPDDREEIIEALTVKRARVAAGEYRFECADAESEKDEARIQKSWVTGLSRLIKKIQGEK